MLCRVAASGAVHQVTQALRLFVDPSVWASVAGRCPDFSGLQALLDECPSIPTPDLPRVAFVGESSSGKSTLINALMGMEVLPSEVAPVTATILHLYPADRLTLVDDAAYPEPSLEDVQAYLTRSVLDATGAAVGRPEVGVGVPTDAMRAMGVSLLDTPGLGGVASESGGDETEAVLRDDVEAACRLSRVVVVCLSPHQAGARAAMEVLRFALECGRPVVVALTKTDGFVPEELDRVRAALTEHVAQLAGSGVPGRRRFYLSERRRSRCFAGAHAVRALDYLKALDRERAPSEEVAAGIDTLRHVLRDLAARDGLGGMEDRLASELERVSLHPQFRLHLFPRDAATRLWPEVRDAIHRNRNYVPSLSSRLSKWETRINSRGKTYG